ncbi:MAG: HAD hydrolase-like protein [Thermodesulfobacteriota bacterium]
MIISIINLSLTNNSFHTPQTLKDRLAGMGIDVPEDCFYTSAMATASFIKLQRPDGCSTHVIGDRMDTDIVGGLEAGMATCLVLSGVTSREGMGRFPYQPDYVFNNLGEIDPETLLSTRVRVEN